MLAPAQEPLRFLLSSDLGLVSRPVRETLAFDTLGNERRTFPVFILRVFHLKSHSREIARQMGFADRMVRAEHGALHEAETAFCRVDVSEAAKPNILVRPND